MGVGDGLYMYNVIVKKFKFAISSPDEFLYIIPCLKLGGCIVWNACNTVFVSKLSAICATVTLSGRVQR